MSLYNNAVKAIFKAVIYFPYKLQTILKSFCKTLKLLGFFYNCLIKYSLLTVMYQDRLFGSQLLITKKTCNLRLLHHLNKTKFLKSKQITNGNFVLCTPNKLCILINNKCKILLPTAYIVVSIYTK